MSSTQHAGSPQGDAPLGVAVIGAGYWGPNLVRNFRGSANWDLVGVCDLNADRARKVIGNRSTVEVFTDLAQVLDRDDVHAVAIATPADGPSFGVAPSGTCTWMSLLSKRGGSMPKSTARERT